MQCQKLKTYMETGRIIFLPVRSIHPNPAQPRKVFRQEALEELGTFTMNAGSTLSDDMDDWIDDAAESAAMLLDVSALEPDEIADVLDEEQDLMRKVLLFRAANAVQAEAALRHYCGVSALYGAGLADIAAKYGAYYLGE